MEKVRIIVVGNGMVGHKIIDNLIQHSKAQNFDITTIGEESRLAYDRVHLSGYFSGVKAEDMALVEAEYYHKNDVNYFLSDPVVHIDREHHSVTTQSGLKKEYDKLILATGSYPFVPPIEGAEQDACFVYRTIDDLEAITMAGESSDVGVVIGGGLLGLEAANALKNMGLETHVVEFSAQLMAVQLDPQAGHVLQHKIEALGVNVHTGKSTQNISAGQTHRYRLYFSDDTILETDLVVFSAGIRPQDELARQSNLDVGERGGIVINDHCQTSDPDIYAIGECALWQSQIFGLVAPGYRMAKVATAHLTGENGAFSGADMSTKLKLLGVEVGSLGDAHAKTPNSQIYTFHDSIKQIYKRLIVSHDGKRLLGAVLVGDTTDYDQLLQSMLNRLPLPSHPAALFAPNMDATDNTTGNALSQLPSDALICTCFDVTKKAIQSAIHDGAETISELKTCTKASTGCGGCGSLVKQLLDHELSELGHDVDNSLCEHFSYSRQQLTDIIRSKRIMNFNELLDEYGTGGGCDVCKPAAASIFASYWNKPILDSDYVSLQDSNDIFLGNIQKDGTYSVVPRIPAGEITPEKLVILGKIGQDFNLYTKITGGQRIDFFGAQLHQLPQIWRRLCDAGFETGHAYGKSVRTVKSCVGDSWCRYGVDDSMTLAIDLENRYKGLRAPHKLKFAVSGCTRECAEAKSKDVGIIATEKGWNLYIGGNGGMRPRHGDLFAADLDRTRLLQYIDRILMFYIRTADRLQRTSVWLESIEGGMAYLQDVVMNDALSIAEQLETEIQYNRKHYECEWAATLNDEEKICRFEHYINSQETDENLSYDTQRGQKRPCSSTQSQRISVLHLEDDKK